jgi:hypothetical protein
MKNALGWTRSLCLAAALVFPLVFAPDASAQISRAGNIENLAAIGGAKGNDVAYDPAHDQYLVLHAFFPVDGFFTNNKGVRQNSFRIRSGGVAEFPRAAYSPDVNGGAGGFLVVWPEEAGGLHSRVVTYPGTLVGSENVISGNSQPVGICPPAVAYSETSKVFLVVWQSITPNNKLRAAVVGLDGARIGNVIELSSGFGRDPGVSWNPVTNQFGVSYSAETSDEHGLSCFAIVSAVAPTTFANRECFDEVPGLKYVSDSSYNTKTGNFLMTWYEIIAGVGARGMKQEFSPQGSRIGSAAPITIQSNTLFGSYDALTTAYNPISGTFAVVGVFGANDNLGAAELGPDGTRTGPRVEVGPDARAHYPRIATNTELAEWNISFSGFSFTQVSNQVIATGTRTGPSSNIQLKLDSPFSGSILGRNSVLEVKGYAADLGATSGTGVDYVTITAVPTNGAPIDLGTVTSFSPRSELTGTLGAQFVNSGFSVTKSGLPSGSYTIRVVPHSTVTNSVGAAATASITVNASLPLMSIDSPGSGAAITGRITVQGWALDRFSDSGAGINAVHIWAFPAGGGAARFFDVATIGLSRPDVGSAFGDTKFNNSGYSATGSLPPGSYTLIAYANDSYSGTFSISSAKTITVQRSAFMAVDTPSGATSVGATISGWAVDLAATSGAGIDVVHVWAFPTNGGPAVWVGQAAVNAPRADLGSALGSQFTNCGYSLTLQNVGAGSYTLVAFGHSAVTGNFDVSIAVPITVN